MLLNKSRCSYQLSRALFCIIIPNNYLIYLPSLPLTMVRRVGGREQSLIQQQLLLIFLSPYRSLAGRNLCGNASKNILKTWPPLMRKLSGDSCSHQLQTRLLQSDGLRSWCSTETAICLGEQLRGLIGIPCFQHISLVLLITIKFNFTSHWRAHSPPFCQDEQSRGCFHDLCCSFRCQHKADLPGTMPPTCISQHCFL